MGKRKVWTNDEIEKLINLVNIGNSNKEIANVLNRTETSVNCKMNKLNIQSKYKNYWTEKEEMELINLVEKEELVENISIILGKTEQSVRQKMSKLKIKSKIMANRSEYKYPINEIVNNSVKIVKHTKYTHSKYKTKGYLVESVKHPGAPHYIMTESELNRGYGCAYSRGLRIYEGNSLYSIERLRLNITDENLEYCKTIAPNDRKPILFKCDNPKCKNTKTMKPQYLTQYGFVCDLCSVKATFGEQVFSNYSYYFNLGYVAEKQLPNSTRRADFTKYNNDGTINTIVEVHGMQHYKEVNTETWKNSHKNSIEQDEYKRKYCKKNNINMIEIDVRFSTWEYFKKQINKCEYLPSINKEDEKEILKLMEVNSKYPIATIKYMYEIENCSIKYIAEKLGYTFGKIKRVLECNGVIINSNNYKKIKCVTTGDYFNSQKEASEEYGVSAGAISMALSEKYNRTYAGRHHITGEKLHWERVI